MCPCMRFSFAFCLFLGRSVFGLASTLSRGVLHSLASTISSLLTLWSHTHSLTLPHSSLSPAPACSLSLGIFPYHRLPSLCLASQAAGVALWQIFCLHMCRSSPATLFTRSYTLFACIWVLFTALWGGLAVVLRVSAFYIYMIAFACCLVSAFASALLVRPRFPFVAFPTVFTIQIGVPGVVACAALTVSHAPCHVMWLTERLAVVSYGLFSLCPAYEIFCLAWLVHEWFHSAAHSVIQFSVLTPN